MDQSVMDCGGSLLSIFIRPLLGHFGIDVTHGRFGSGLYVQFFKHALEMGSDRVKAHVQIVSDQFVGMALRDQLEDLLFTRGQV